MPVVTRPGEAAHHGAQQRGARERQHEGRCQQGKVARSGYPARHRQHREHGCRRHGGQHALVQRLLRSYPAEHAIDLHAEQRASHAHDQARQQVQRAPRSRRQPGVERPHQMKGRRERHKRRQCHSPRGRARHLAGPLEPHGYDRARRRHARERPQPCRQEHLAASRPPCPERDGRPGTAGYEPNHVACHGQRDAGVSRRGVAELRAHALAVARLVEQVANVASLHGPSPLSLAQAYRVAPHPAG